MSYADGLLATGEQISYRTKQHPFIFLWGARYTILALIIAVILFWFGGNLDPTGFSGGIRQLLGWITVVLFVGGIAVAVWTALRFVNQEYVLSNRRVIQVEGVVNRRATDSSLEKINDAVLTQSFFGRMFDFGDLTVLTASESGAEKFKMIRSPIRFKKAMLDAKHEYEVDMERSGWAPSPPSGRMLPRPPRRAGMRRRRSRMRRRRPPARSARDPDEVTRTLASLADLRDRGAISAEEYEAKKGELLSRL
jgi:hypothetical protein